MNIEEMKKSAINMVDVNDSLASPLLKLKVKVSENTIIPNTNELIVYVSNNSEETSEKKTYIFNLKEKLEISNEFILEPVFDESKVLVKGYVQREELREEISVEPIMMFEGINYISTNYKDADVSIVYPKNMDLVNYFLNTSIYGINNKNKVLTLDDLYFKDCFTENDGYINAKFNELKVKCISSESDGFRLDYAGNLRVKSLIVMDHLGESDIDIDLIYPVGSIYMSLLNVNPSTLFGGTWERIAKGRTLVGVDEFQTEFNSVEKTGGEKAHKLTISEMPSHNHGLDHSIVTYSDIQIPIPTEAGNTKTGFYYHASTQGGNQEHNNLQPYFTCYIWSRIA